VTVFPFRDSRRSTSDRVSDLLSRMTVSEKVGQMLQLDARGDLEDLLLVKLGGSLLHASPDRMVQAHELIARTRLRIPLLMADDAIHGHSFWPGATIFPTQLAMACTWDPHLIELGARAAAEEISVAGLHWTFSPVLCIARDLRWGRVGETFGEDPHLIGELGAAMIRGYQGRGLADKTAVLATAKHFAGYSETQGGRDASEADLSERKLRSWFLPPFQRAVEAGCATFMIGYQAIDGVPITANKWLLNDVLKGEWGFQGTLVTDWDNVGRMVWEQRVCVDDLEAAIVAVTAGNDLVMNTPQFSEAAQRAVAQGRLDEGAIDAAVGRILKLKFDLGLFEDPRAPDRAAQARVIGSTEHVSLNLAMARRTLVLLKNTGLLPLPQGLPPTGDTASTSAAGVRVAVVGPLADDIDAQLGDWAGSSGQIDWMPDGHPRELTVTVREGLSRFAPPGWSVQYQRGADVGELIPDPLGETYSDGQPRPPIFVAAKSDAGMLTDAIAASKAADVVIVVVGDTVALTGEGRSTATLDLQGSQIALLDAVASAGTPYVVVLVQSKPSTLPESALGAAAIIQAFNPGMQGGRAIAELIYGQIEPSGRLPISIARHVGQLPVFYNQVRGQHGDRYADLTQDPLFPFGFGLSYTTIEYSNLKIASAQVGRLDTVRATVTVTNRGTRPALETVQAYISDLTTSVTWAELELKSFAQVSAPAGMSIAVALEIPVASCSLVDRQGNRVVEAGQFDLLVGPSSRAESLLRGRFEVVDDTC